MDGYNLELNAAGLKQTTLATESSRQTQLQVMMGNLSAQKSQRSCFLCIHKKGKRCDCKQTAPQGGCLNTARLFLFSFLFKKKSQHASDDTPGRCCNGVTAAALKECLAACGPAS